MGIEHTARYMILVPVHCIPGGDSIADVGAYTRKGQHPIGSVPGPSPSAAADVGRSAE